MYNVFIINILGFGGAQMTIGHYKALFVDTKIITLSQLNQYIALSNVLPGAMSLYISGLIGYQLYHKRGIVYGVSMCVFPIMFLTIIVYQLLLLTGINFDFLIYIILPLIIVNSFKYVHTLKELEMGSWFKYSVFIVCIFLLVIVKISSLSLIILFFLVNFILSYLKRGDYVN